MKTERELLAPDAKRDIGAELLQSVRQVNAGKTKRGIKIELTPAAEGRVKTGLSQSEFSDRTGVSLRTLQDCEQGRRNPSGAALTLIRIARLRQNTLLEIGAN